MDIAARIKEQRSKLGITQQQLAFDTGLSVAGIQSIETGRAKPNIETLAKLASRFGVSADYLLGHEVAVPKYQKSWNELHEFFEKQLDTCQRIFRKDLFEQIKSLVESIPRSNDPIPSYDEEIKYSSAIILLILQGSEEYRNELQKQADDLREQKKDSAE